MGVFTSVLGLRRYLVDSKYVPDRISEYASDDHLILTIENLG